MNSASTWPMGKVAAAADVKLTTLRQWFATGVLQLRGDDKAFGGTGHHIGLSKQRAYEARILQQLTRHGVAPSRAARGAFAFTINGNNGRAAGQLFPLGKTVLAFRQHDAVVANVDPDARVSDLSNNGVAIVVDLNKIVADVDSVLNNSNTKKDSNDDRTRPYLTRRYRTYEPNVARKNANQWAQQED